MRPSDTSKLDLHLYVFLNLAYDSMGRGRCAAQASHIANDFTDRYIIQPLLDGGKPDPEVMAWRNQAGSFGTQIVKAVANIDQLKLIVQVSSAIGAKSGTVVDPEYVIQDGTSFHTVNDLITGGFVFGDKTVLAPLLFQYPLLLNDAIDRKQQFNL